MILMVFDDFCGDVFKLFYYVFSLIGSAFSGVSLMACTSFCSSYDSSELSKFRSSFLIKKLFRDLIFGIKMSIFYSSLSDEDDPRIY